MSAPLYDACSHNNFWTNLSSITEFTPNMCHSVLEIQLNVNDLDLDHQGHLVHLLITSDGGGVDYWSRDYYKVIYGKHASQTGVGWGKDKSIGHLPNGTGEMFARQVKFPAHLPEGRWAKN